MTLYGSRGNSRIVPRLQPDYPDLGSDWKEQGAESLWIKPTNLPELLEQIESLLARQQITTRRKKKTSIAAKGVQLPSGATRPSL